MQKLILSLPSTTVWTIENPLRSWLWQTSYFQAIKEQIHVFFFQFDMCMFGGRRLKRTGIATNCENVQSFAMQCDGLHEHALGGALASLYEVLCFEQKPFTKSQKLFTKFSETIH
jgi:hypothetical protein